jgi:uncharacterized SAM-binding protein YcdF (DUF218 family)
MQNMDLSATRGLPISPSQAAPEAPKFPSRFRVWLPLLLIILCVAAYGAARFLVVDSPQPADAILVLAGETNVRLARALQLASQGYAPRIMVNVPDWTVFYGHSEVGLARDWARAQAVPVIICPTHGLSTKDEARDAARCLDEAHVGSVLVVTSEFHTRRALSTLRHQLAGHTFSIAGAYDPVQFGFNWWQHRQWTKTTFYEWTRLVWWEFVDRWV